MATKKEIYTKKSDGSLQFVGYLPTEDVVSALTYTTDIGGINTRLSTAESNISDRYTKGEVDLKVDDKMRYMQTVAKWAFDGNGQYKYCKIATIKLVSGFSNKPIIFECTGRGYQYAQTISIYPSMGESTTTNYGFRIFRTTDDMGWGIKDEGNGLCSLYCELSEVWGNVVVNRVYGDGIRWHTVTMVMKGATGFPDGTVFASPIIHALKSGEATHASSADNATLANSVSSPYRSGLTYDNIESLPQYDCVTFDLIDCGEKIGGLNKAWWYVMSMKINPGDGFDYSCQLAMMMTSKWGNGEEPQLAFRNKTNLGLNDWRVVISDKTIGQQVVKSFTATEVNHGCKFNGDLSSTTLVSSPLHMAVSEFNTSEANSPTAPRTLTGNIEVTFGSAKKTIANMKYNPFMKYFFEHGYHFSAVKEGGDSTLYDKGIVTYGQFIYYCVYAYHSDGSDAFDAAILMTDDTKEMSKYVMYESGKAKDLMIEGNYIKTDGLKRVNIQEKAGTLALLSDIPSVPSVVDNLTSTSSYSALSAYQGKVLNDKINGIKFSQLATGSLIGGIGLSNSRGDEDLTYSAHLSGGSKGGRFYVISGLENGYNSDYGKLVVKTSSNGKADMTTNAVAGVSGETGYWNPQWLSVSVFVPAGKDYYLWGCRINKVYYSCAELSK